MKRSVLLLVIISVLSSISPAQGLKGKITNETGSPVQYATVYIQELKQGATANSKGDYEIKLPPGSYMVTYQSLGYSPVFIKITVSDQSILKDVILPLQYYQIPEVRISASGEDPAYSIMRKAIGMAPYYLNNVKYYKADLYLKGTLLINKIPKLFQKSMKIGSSGGSAGKSGGARKEAGEQQIKEGSVYLMESFNEIVFNAPDKYDQKIISINSTFPDQGDNVSPMDFIQASFYQPVLADVAISPLSPRAFSHYKFRYLGATPQSNLIISKIQVIPKIKSQQLFEGTIYIIEDLWCLHSVDLTNENIAGKIRVQQLYIPVQDGIWMPVNHKFDMNIQILGFRADAGYTSSIKYTVVDPNTSLKKPESIEGYSPERSVADQEEQTRPPTRNQDRIEEILGKEEMSNRDMFKLTRLMEKESKAALPDSTLKNLEIKDNTTQTVGKDANKKDSIFWAEIRPIPLTDLEIKSIHSRDSIKLIRRERELNSDTVNKTSTKEKSKLTRTINNIGTGHTWRFDTTGSSFTFGGLLDVENLSFNTVDGFIYGVDFRFTKRFRNKNQISIYPDLKYAFSRERFLFVVNSTFNFNSFKQKQLFLRTGVTSKVIGTGGSINTLLNSVSSLFFRQNYLKLYETGYVAFGYRGEISNGLNIETTARYDDRRVLENSTGFSFLSPEREYSDNTPDNIWLAEGANPVYELRDQKHFEFVTNVTFTPRQKYKIYNEVKVPQRSEWPIFTLTWKHGLNEFSEPHNSYKHFDMIRFQVSKVHDAGAFRELRWRVNTGGFLNNTWLPYYDFYHFNTQPLPLVLNDYPDAFKLPSYYSVSTPEFFTEAHLKYTTPYFVVKHLPLLSKTLMRENISLSWLGSGFHSNYTEIGYSVSEIFLFAEVGIYAGFNDLEHRSTGIRIILKID